MSPYVLENQDKDIKEAVETIQELEQNEDFWRIYDAREDRLRQEKDMELHYTEEIAKRDVELKKNAEELARNAKDLVQKDDIIAQLTNIEE